MPVPCFMFNRSNQINMPHKINPFAERFALRTGGALLFHHGLNLVLYDYGSSPSLACWTGRQRKRSENLHFLSPQAREYRIEELRRRRTSHLLYRKARRIERRLKRIAT